MPILIGLALAVIGFVWWNWGRDRARSEMSNKLDPFMDRLMRKRPCRWVQAGRGKGGFDEYRCDTCNVVAYSRTGKPPETCKRTLGGGL